MRSLFRFPTDVAVSLVRPPEVPQCENQHSAGLWRPHSRKHVLRFNFMTILVHFNLVNSPFKQLHVQSDNTASSIQRFLVCFWGIQQPLHTHSPCKQLFLHTKPLSSANHGPPSSLHAADKTVWTLRRFPNGSLQAPSCCLDLSVCREATWWWLKDLLFWYAPWPPCRRLKQ